MKYWKLQVKGFKDGAIVIDHTTTSAKGAIQRTEGWKSKGFTYVHAPVFMGPQNALESSGFMLVSGDQAVIKEVGAGAVENDRKAHKLWPRRR
ncbi:MAG: NAD(P)-binding domain-containing protein [Segetibacter sp.]